MFTLYRQESGQPDSPIYVSDTLAKVQDKVCILLKSLRIIGVVSNLTDDFRSLDFIFDGNFYHYSIRGA